MKIYCRESNGRGLVPVFLTKSPLKLHKQNGKRKITIRQEQAYRLTSEDFQGLSVQEAATRMNITPIGVYKLLQMVRKKAPQLFNSGAEPRKILSFDESMSTEVREKF
jgi:predicted DNA-binding protein (UPF0251 family)